MNKKALVTLVVVAAVAAAAGNLYARRTIVQAPETAARSADAELAAAHRAAGASTTAVLDAGRPAGKVIAVKPGESIQAAVARAQPGDTVQVLPGTYHETVYIDKDNIALVGVIHGSEWPTLDGEGKRNDAVLYSGNGIRVENLKILNFKGNAIMGQAGNNFIVRHNWIANAGVYGIFPEFAQNGLIEYNILTGIEDAAIYVGMSDNIHVAHNEVYGNVAGIEIENSRHAVVEHNLAYDNAGVYGIFPEFAQNGLIEYNTLTGIEDAAIYVGMSDNIHVAHNEVYGNVAGIEIENSRHAVVENNMVTDNAGGVLAFITPGLPIKTCFDVVIRNNFIVGNNHKNFAAEGSIVSGVPSGTGVVIMAADDVILDNNVIRDNRNAGVIILDHKTFANVTPDPEADPNPDRTQILRNFFANNGTDPIREIQALMLTELTRQGPDVVATGGGKDSCALDKSGFKSVGLGSWVACKRRNTADIATYLLDQPAEPRRMEIGDKGKLLYSAICAGCHAYSSRMVGPPTQVIQALYTGNPQGIADYIAKPVKKRDDFPPMPPQSHLSPEMRLAVAQYLLTVK